MSFAASLQKYKVIMYMLYLKIVGVWGIVAHTFLEGMR